MDKQPNQDETEELVDDAPERTEPEGLTVDVSDERAFEVISSLLEPEDYMLAGLKSRRVETPDHSERFDRAGDSCTLLEECRGADLEQLLAYEEECQVQIERLNVLEDIFSEKIQNADGFQQFLSDQAKAYELAFRSAVTYVRVLVNDSGVERAVNCLHSFITEASTKTGEQNQLIYVLNAPANVKKPDDEEVPYNVFEDPQFSSYYAGLENLMKKFESSYALWVTNSEYLNSTHFKSIAKNANSADSLVFVNADMSSFAKKRIDRQENDGLGKGEDADWLLDTEIQKLNKLTGALDEFENVVVCANFVRVRRAEKDFGEQFDVVIPCSYAYAGKVFHVSSVDENSCTAVNVASLDEDFSLDESYTVQVESAHGPMLYSCDRALNNTTLENVVTLRFGDAGMQKTDKGKYLLTFTGSRTAKVGGRPFPVVLTEKSLNRYTKYLEQKYSTRPTAQIAAVRDEISRELSELAHESDDSKPLTKLDIEIVGDDIVVTGVPKTPNLDFKVELKLGQAAAKPNAN